MQDQSADAFFVLINMVKKNLHESFPLHGQTLAPFLRAHLSPQGQV